jgi:hypothetical protein
MKSLEDLKKLRDESLKKMNVRYLKDGFRIQVKTKSGLYSQVVSAYVKKVLWSLSILMKRFMLMSQFQ